MKIYTDENGLKFVKVYNTLWPKEYLHGFNAGRRDAKRSKPAKIGYDDDITSYKNSYRCGYYFNRKNNV